MNKRKGFNPKRKLCKLSDTSLSAYKGMGKIVQYGGNPEHKCRPNDYGLTPMRNPRPGKTLCDAEGEFKKASAEKLLKAAFEHGMCSEQTRGQWPQNVWVVEGTIAFEAELENRELGVYHGYPMPGADPFLGVVLAEWERRA